MIFAVGLTLFLLLPNTVMTTTTTAQLLLVVLQLSFEAEVGTNVGATAADQFDGWGELAVELLHVVGDN